MKSTYKLVHTFESGDEVWVGTDDDVYVYEPRRNMSWVVEAERSGFYGRPND